MGMTTWENYHLHEPFLGPPAERVQPPFVAALAVVAVISGAMGFVLAVLLLWLLVSV